MNFCSGVVLPNSAKAAHIYGGGYYGAADQCTDDLLQSGKPIGVGLSDKTAGSILSVLPVCIGSFAS